jgi:tRNA uridine 5-carboxymethylaminomethyl modification enzyme
MKKQFCVVVIGAGHSGTEAALASARMKCDTLLVTLNIDRIGECSCNPAIGGVGKGQLVKEVDALGGQMGLAADACGIQFRQLNTSYGPAVRSSRCQIDRSRYRRYIRQILENQEGLRIIQAEVTRILIKNNSVCGIQLNGEEDIECAAIVFCPGTFCRGLIHIGLENFPCGRIQEKSVSKIAHQIQDIGFKIGRFKTGTCPRLDIRSINLDKIKKMQGDNPPIPFSFRTKDIKQEQISCYAGCTNKTTHQIILDNLYRSPLYTGAIKARGVRYCPSIEDKVVRFSERERHPVFIEPEGTDTFQVYPNGISTSLPRDVQEKMVHSIEGLEKAEFLEYGYGIEYDYIDPTQLDHTLQSKNIKGLFFAGQINGTTGYEEAAAQGLVAGINSALFVQNKQKVILERHQGYIGVLIDDLITKGTDEPYRMFTSRVEHRLILREDNADLRLSELGYRLGLLPCDFYKQVQEKRKTVEQEKHRLRSTTICPVKNIVNHTGIEFNKPVSLAEFLKRPDVTYPVIELFDENVKNVPDDVALCVQADIKYEGYIQRQMKEIEKTRFLSRIIIPQEMNFSKIPGLSNEIIEKLFIIKPTNLSQASRIPGITPSAISILNIYIEKEKSLTQQDFSGRTKQRATE